MKPTKAWHRFHKTDSKREGECEEKLTVLHA